MVPPLREPENGERSESGELIPPSAPPVGSDGVRYHLSYAVYDVIAMVLGVVALPFVPLLLLTRHGRGLSERLGQLPRGARRLRRPVWLHAASVGEVLAAEPLIRQLRSHLPALPILVSTTSVTGRETARTRLGVNAVLLLPLDLMWIIDRTIRLLQPRCLIIVETELWPALLRAAARRAVPVVMVSGRISARAARRYAWIRWLTRAALSHVRAFAMQTDADAARIVALGAPAARVQVAGSLKFARYVDTDTTAGGTPTADRLDGRLLLVAASTHPGEEQLVLDACARLWLENPDILVLIAPRRPERFDDVERLLARREIRHQRWSRLSGTVKPDTQVLLLDTVGELLDFLPAARAVFVGGSVAPVGGHNVLEPAQFGKPVAFGPHTGNVGTAAHALLDRAAATQIHDAEQLHTEWRRLLHRPDLAVEMGARGRAVVAAGAAVAERTFELVRRCLPET
jgi:3-deoxy-D-manno-octulosonic-acid transferase